VTATAIGTLILDLDGVVYLDGEGVPGARETLERFRDSGWQLLYATNNSTKSGATVAEHIRSRTGFRADPDDAFTSAMAAAHHVANDAAGVSAAMVVGASSITAELLARGIAVRDDDVDAVVVGLDLAITYERLDLAARRIREGAAFVATNTDATYPTPSGLAPGAGTIVAAISTASGVEPVNCGKPTRTFGDMVARRITGQHVVMVGDKPETDIALGKAYGWSTVLVLTGVTGADDDVPAIHRADMVVPSIAGLDPATLLTDVGRP
jgi:HAD superfamily hydrolase (TIGR01450 family)